ncbi:MAG TPA: Hsp20/alpha crystallin family protein [Pirellulales bacterium]|jgi:HSP20 family protein|nr:Hsp20/alpha crystallin family protein [Pirellulales bacterium]
MNAESTLNKVEAGAVDEASRSERTRGGTYYQPNVDILEKENELLLLADMPGAKADAIDVRFEEGELTIHAPVTERQSDDAKYLLAEYGVGDFYRTFRVSEQIDAAKIHAEYSDGVLRLHLPKVEAAKPRRITVTAQ